jgi:hypothetical protein
MTTWTLPASSAVMGLDGFASTETLGGCSRERDVAVDPPPTPVTSATYPPPKAKTALASSDNLL